LPPGNLLVVGGRCSAVIDFGGTDIGDPARDLLPAWNVFTGASRQRYMVRPAGLVRARAGARRLSRSPDEHRSRLAADSQRSRTGARQG
jgi:aminoglycoside phosphotransferase (APT) family kinase protein